MTEIEWTHRPGTKGESWNPIRARNRATGGVGHFCEHVSEGCRNCYAEAMQGWRFDNPIRYAAQDRAKVEIFLDKKVLAQPLHWRKPRTVFVCSMTDLYGPWVPDEWIDKIKAVEALCPQHTFIELTKRPDRMEEYSNQPYLAGQIWDNADEIACDNYLSEFHPSSDYLIAGRQAAAWPLPNVWEGTSVEDQESANKNIPELLSTPAAVHFVSYEPALGPVDFSRLGLWLCKNWKSQDALSTAPWCPDDPSKWWWTPQALRGPGQVMLDWVICGGESGPGARPMHPDWARSIREQCIAARVPFFFKQWGAWRPLRADDRSGGRERWADFDDDGNLEMSPITISHHDNGAMFRAGKKAAGRMLDGREWNEWPEVAR